MRLDDVDALAQRQNGVVHLDQTGWSRSAWYRALSGGSLVAVHPHVARCVGSPSTELLRIRAATLSIPDAVASHRSAAVLWGLVAPDDAATVHVTSRAEPRHHASLDGVVSHRPRDRLDLRAVVRRGIPATPPLRSLLDLGISDPTLVHGAVGTALGDGLLSIAAIEAGLCRHAEHGRTGVVALRTALDAWAIDARPADSVLEVAFADLCRRHGLPPVSFHERIEGWEVDFRFVGTAIVVECDGWTTHGRRRRRFEQDRRKDDDLRAAGWIPARFTYRAITRRPGDTARRLRRLLERWGDLTPPDELAA